MKRYLKTENIYETQKFNDDQVIFKYIEHTHIKSKFGALYVVG